VKRLTQLIIAIGALSLLAGVTEPWLSGYFHVMTIADWVGLSISGLKHLYLWQIVSWPLIEPTHFEGISFSFLISLAFYLYILWTFGLAYINNLGESSFFRFLIATTLFLGVLGALTILVTGSFATLIGPTPILLALFTVWTLMNSENDMLLLFVLPIKTKWLLSFLLGGSILVAISKGSLLFFMTYPGAILWGYFYGILVLEQWSPFPSLNAFENKLHNWRGRWTKGRTTVEDASQKIKGKVIDLHTGKPHLEDDEFLEEMLDKISKSGEDSLSWTERRRLDEISRKRPH
jgi:hypothetical protein